MCVLFVRVRMHLCLAVVFVCVECICVCVCVSSVCVFSWGYSQTDAANYTHPDRRVKRKWCVWFNEQHKHTATDLIIPTCVELTVYVTQWYVNVVHCRPEKHMNINELYNVCRTSVQAG
ncbi:unnamed protein product [Arctogadus glacialis]